MGTGQVPPPSRQCEKGQGQAIADIWDRSQVHSKQKGQVQVASRHEGQVQMHLRQSGQVVLGPSRLTGQVLAFRRPTRQVTVPLMNQMGQMRQVQAPSSHTE